MVYRFGPFELDAATKRLFRGDARIPLAAPYAAILLRLVSEPGQVLSKDTLANAGWDAVAVAENSVQKAISRLRQALGEQPDGTAYIETLPNVGYRFAAPVSRGERLPTADVPDEDLAADRACFEGRQYLSTLKRDDIQRARAKFEEALQHSPDYAPALIGLTLACALGYESTRFDASCDLKALRLAVVTGRRATTRAPGSGEAWSNLAFALCLNGEAAEAVAAASRAIALEPGDWRHLLRLGFVSWGEERRRAAQEVVKISGRLALAHWQAATVLVARGAFDPARDELQRGCAAQDAEAAGYDIFQGVGLHLLHGLVLAAQDRLDDAVGEFERELSGVSGRTHVYARECAANTWYALGAVRLRQCRRDEAQSAFQRALAGAPGHLSAAAALGLAIPAVDSGDPSDPSDPRMTDAAIARAVALARAGRHADAAQAYRQMLEAAPIPSAGWLLPAEPLLNAGAHPEIWRDLLTIVRQRAL